MARRCLALRGGTTGIAIVSFEQSSCPERGSGPNEIGESAGGERHTVAALRGNAGIVLAPHGGWSRRPAPGGRRSCPDCSREGASHVSLEDRPPETEPWPT